MDKIYQNISYQTKNKKMVEKSLSGGGGGGGHKQPPEALHYSIRPAKSVSAEQGYILMYKILYLDVCIDILTYM